jgi:hypothetical protein
MKTRDLLLRLAMVASLCGAAYVLGALSHSRELWPIPQLRQLKAELSGQRAPAQAARQPSAAEPGGPVLDTLNRLVNFPGEKVEVDCLVQGPRTIVLLLIGQSNAANFHGQRHVSGYGDRIVNYFDGRCYRAASPLLGTSGHQGESWTLLGNKLIAAGLADSVVLVPAAIGGSRITRWQAGGDLNTAMLEQVAGAMTRYRFTHVLWHQGESDFTHDTPADRYTAMFDSLLGSLRGQGVDAPVFVSVASRCRDYDKWHPDNAIAAAQQALPDSRKGTYSGVNTDALMEFPDRHDDCHFGASGQELFADAWLSIIANHRPEQSSSRVP